MKDIWVPEYIATTLFDDSAVLLDLRKNVYYALNGSAADFWNSMTQTGEFEEALKQVLSQYEVDADVVRKDMESLVSSLLKVGLIHRVPSGS
ncbi:PqqD family protein [Microseira sp. BLCC-F43]|uniref:PqqD family protein n=1 Tax=Microseira sp. BLCC-F43 TaxID=3153602 RepID=UPI0035BAD517